MKKIKAKIGEYQKDGQTKGQYVDIGVIMTNNNGEYMLVNPTIDLAGVLMSQRLLAQQTGKKPGNSVMCSIWDEQQNYADNAAQQPAAHPRVSQQAPAQYSSAAEPNNFDDEIPPF